MGMKTIYSKPQRTELTQRAQKYLNDLNALKSLFKSKTDAIPDYSKTYAPAVAAQMLRDETKSIKDDFLKRVKDLLSSVETAKATETEKMLKLKLPLTMSIIPSEKAIGEAQINTAKNYLGFQRTFRQIIQQIDLAIQMKRMDYLSSLTEELLLGNNPDSEIIDTMMNKVAPLYDSLGITEAENTVHDLEYINGLVSTYSEYLNGEISSTQMGVMSLYKN